MSDGDRKQHPLVASHGAAKQTEPGDPLELVGTSVPEGDSDYLARCFIEEFARMGHDGTEILTLFRHPAYAALHAFYRRCGEREVRRLINEVLAECGVWRFRDETPACGGRRARPVQIELPSDGVQETRP